MKKLLLTITIFTLVYGLQAQNVGIGTNTPNASAKLDVTATDKGFLPPRVNLTATNATTPISSPATGLLVYNQATAGIVPNNVTPGYYYWDGSKWVRVDNQPDHDWHKTNGTADQGQSTTIGDNIYTNGNVGIGTVNPTTDLDINGSIKISGGSPENGKVLTAIDTDGNAVWEKPDKGLFNSGSVTMGNWYRIAQNDGSGKRANAEFTLRDYISGGGHSTLRFIAGISYNNASDASFTLLNHSIYSTATFTKVRILEGSTYDIQYLEVYVERTGNVDYSIKDNLQSNDWQPVDWVLSTGIPGGYNAIEYEVNKLMTVGDSDDRFTINRGGNVGIGTSSPTTNLDVNGTVRIRGGSPASGNVLTATDANGNAQWMKAGQTIYQLPNTAGTAQWVKLGTLTIGQGGQSAYFKIISNSGYNAATSQNNEVFIRFKTSNAISVDANGFAGDATYWYTGAQDRFYNSDGIKFVANTGGTGATSYDLYMNFKTYTGAGSFYTVETTSGTWTHIGALGQTDPGAGSSSVLVVPHVYNSDDIYTSGKVGIGTNNPVDKLEVVGGNIKINGTTNTNNITGGKLIYNNTSGLGGGVAQKVERNTKVQLTNNTTNYEVYSDPYVSIAVYRSSSNYYLTMSPKTGHTGWWDYTYDSGGSDVNCATAGTYYIMGPNIGVSYTGGVEVVINKEGSLTYPTYRVWPHLHSSTGTAIMTVIVEAWYP
ncbi:MAG: hypothetical protein H6578_05120 [Chitinophagales bacterium]|nr:hypothetical protein [Chitinophagales bacterium]